MSWKTIQTAPFAIDFIIMGDNASAATNNVVISTDGTTWSAVDVDRSEEWAYSTFGSGVMYAAQFSGDPSYSIYNSTNTLNWDSDLIVNFSAGSAVVIRDLLWNGSQLLVAGKRGDEGIVLRGVAGDANPWPSYRWADASDYTINRIGYNGTNTYMATAMPQDGPSFTAVNYIYRNQGDPISGTWSQVTLPATLQWSQLVYGNGRWLVFARNSTTVAISTNDGTTWTTGTLPANYSGELNARADFGFGLFHIYNGSRVRTSVDGIVWRSSVNTYNFTDITDWNFYGDVGLATGTRSVGNHTTYLRYLNV